MMLSWTSRPTLIFPVEDPRVDPPREKCSHPCTKPSKFSKGAAARLYALRAWRCAHTTPARVDRPGSNRQIHRFSGFFLLRSFKIATTACDGMRRLLEWSLGAASDDHAALEDGLSMRIGKPTAGNQCVSQVELITRSGHFFSRKRPERYMDRKFLRCARLRIWGSAPPGSGDPFSNARPRHARGGVARPGSHAPGGASKRPPG